MQFSGKYTVCVHISMSNLPKPDENVRTSVINKNVAFHVRDELTWSPSLHNDAVGLLSLLDLLWPSGPLHGQRRRLDAPLLDGKAGAAWFGFCCWRPLEALNGSDFYNAIAGLIPLLALLLFAKLVDNALHLSFRNSNDAVRVVLRRGGGLHWGFWGNLRSGFCLSFEGYGWSGPLGCLLDGHSSRMSLLLCVTPSPDQSEVRIWWQKSMLPSSDGKREKKDVLSPIWHWNLIFIQWSMQCTLTPHHWWQ